MDIINLCEHNSLVGQFMSEIRDKQLQQERLRFHPALGSNHGL